MRQTPTQRTALLEFVSEHYTAGRSLRELAELTGRTQSVLCTRQGTAGGAGISVGRAGRRPGSAGGHV
ncbi:helix-turn-helix domain-containing protein [Phycicoccus mangrovi]|uniref:helix-turn-helix domain-containing protein n=1 Tax=Phycicoccus mangrovi TaxID=2840470 RepID=UPI0035571AB1